MQSVPRDKVNIFSWFFYIIQYVKGYHSYMFQIIKNIVCTLQSYQLKGQDHSPKGAERPSWFREVHLGSLSLVILPSWFKCNANFLLLSSITQYSDWQEILHVAYPLCCWGKYNNLQWSDKMELQQNYFSMDEWKIIQWNESLTHLAPEVIFTSRSR